MSTNDPHLDENAKSTLDEERDEEDVTDNLDDLFALDEQDSDEDEAPVSREEYNRLVKGAKKLSSELGRIKATIKPTEEKTTTKTSENVQNDDVTELFFEQRPEAQFVEKQLREVADKLYGGSILKAWKNEEYLREKAVKMSGENSEREENKRKLTTPTQGGKFGGGKLSYDKIDLSNPEHVKMIHSDPKYRDGYNAFLLGK